MYKIISDVFCYKHFFFFSVPICAITVSGVPGGTFCFCELF
jgi:hypothetical protein